MTSVRLIKSHPHDPPVVHDVFNEYEARIRHRQIIDDAHAEAKRIIDNARAETESLAEQVQQHAHNTGLNDGLRAAEGRIEQIANERAIAIAESRIQATLPAIDQAVVELRGKRDELIQSWEDSAIEVCFALVEQIVHKHIELNPNSIRSMIAEPLRLVAGCDRIELRLHPDDCNILGQRPEDFVSDLSGCHDVRLVKDENMTRGGCVVSTNHGEIDAQIETQLQRIADEINTSCAVRQSM